MRFYENDPKGAIQLQSQSSSSLVPAHGILNLCYVRLRRRDAFFDSQHLLWSDMVLQIVFASIDGRRWNPRLLSVARVDSLP